MRRRLKIGIVRFVNSIPLAYGMERYGEIVRDVPSGLAHRFDAGELDVSFVPSVYYLTHASKCYLVPGISISSVGPTTSVLLCSRSPLAEVKTVLRSTDSMTSNFLAQVILKERYGMAPRFVADEKGSEAQAWLVIGDRALARQDATTCLDVGTEWLAMTGLPVVYAVCVARDAVLARALAPAFCHQTERNIENLDSILQELGQPEWTKYLRGLDYGLTDDHLRALERISEFLKKQAAA